MSPWPVTKMIGMSRFAAASSSWRSRPLLSGNLMSSTRQVGQFGGSDSTNSEIDANSWTLMPSDRNSRPIDARRAGSSSITNTVEVSSDIAATPILELPQVQPYCCILISRPEKLHSSLESVDQGLGNNATAEAFS